MFTRLIAAAKPRELRPTTNLVSDFILPPSDNRRGFLYFYNVYHNTPSPVFFAKLFFGGVLHDLVYNPKFGKDKKVLRELFHDEKGSSNLKFPKGTLSIKRMANEEEPYYLVKFPVFTISSDSGAAYNFLRSFFKVADFRIVDEVASQPVELPHSIDLANAKQNLQAKGALEIALDDCFISGELVDTTENPNHMPSYTAYVTMRIEAFEAEQLTSTPFNQIRPNDIYAILLNWAVGYYGAFKRPAKTSFPIAKIAASLPQSALIKPRVNAESITILSDGSPFMVPTSLNAVKEYDNAYIEAGQRADGVFQLVDPKDDNEERKRRELPANKPIFVDWANAKFTYSTTRGHLHVMDLAQARVPNPTQLVRLAKSPVEIHRLISLLNIGSGLGHHTTFMKATPQEIEATPLELRALAESGNTIDFFTGCATLYPSLTGRPRIRWCDLNGIDEIPSLAAIGRLLNDIGALAFENIDAMYSKYSVHYTCMHLPWFVIVGIYSEPVKLADLESQDFTARDVYYDQAPDPDWKDESLPLAGESLGQLPHQKRARNQLRNFPPSAMLSVPAGGGKTPLIITDILKFVKANKGFPYLIMCPSHLVAQYVSEIAFFTGGKLNAIPINTSTINTNSLERITAMIQQAPRNTVVIVDYDVTSRIMKDDIMYGTTQTTVYHVIEFLRQFDFQYVALDEAHYLRRDSGRTEAVQSLIVDVPYKRLASGTFAHDSMSDLVSQIGIIDPTMFGSRDKFNEEYGLETRGGRVTVWKQDAEQQVNSVIRGNIVVARAHRKEWAALLPPFKEYLHIVTLTPNQKLAYDNLLNSVTAELEQKAATNPLLRKWLKNQIQDTNNPDATIEEVEDDDITAESLEQLLQLYLGRVERFLTAMGRDDWGKANLTGDDLVSPKITKIIEIIRSHIDQKIPGKIIVFTNFIWSAEEIYNALPPDIKSRFLYYQASNKTEIIAQFEQPEILGMVGVSASMDTGLNLQSASRLIREGLPWNPGTLEQGDSRIGRPQLKTVDKRDFIYYDTVICQNTLEVTKIARLYSKLLSVEKYNNAGDGRYAQLPNLDVLAMNFNTIIDVNDINQPEVMDYVNGYSEYKKIRSADYEAYREKYKQKALILEPIPKAADPVDAQIMSHMVYAPGGTIYGLEQLGLVRLDQYLLKHVPATEEDSEAEIDDADESVSDDWVQRANIVCKNKPCHTQLGEGVINRILKNAVTVRLKETGEDIVAARSTVFVKDKPVANVRTALAKITGLKPQVGAVVPAPYEEAKRKLAEQAKAEQEADEYYEDEGEEYDDTSYMEIWPVVINGFLGLEYYPNGDDDPNVATLQSLGFRYNQQYKYAEVANAQRLLKQFQVWADAGFTLDTSLGDVSGQFEVMYRLLKSKKLSNHSSMYKYAKDQDLRNFMRLQIKPSNKATLIRCYPLIENGVAYIALPFKGQSGNRKAITKRAPGIVWQDAEPVLQLFTLNIPKTVQVLENLTKSGVQISNSAEVKKELRLLKRQSLREEATHFSDL